MGEPVDINCGRERFPSRGRRVRVAMVGVCQEDKVWTRRARRTDKKQHDDALSEQACVCSPSPGHPTNVETAFIPVADCLALLLINKRPNKRVAPRFD